MLIIFLSPIRVFLRKMLMLKAALNSHFFLLKRVVTIYGKKVKFYFIALQCSIFIIGLIYVKV